MLGQRRGRRVRWRGRRPPDRPDVIPRDGSEAAQIGVLRRAGRRVDGGPPAVSLALEDGFGEYPTAQTVPDPGTAAAATSVASSRGAETTVHARALAWAGRASTTPTLASVAIRTIFTIRVYGGRPVSPTGRPPCGCASRRGASG